MEQDKKVFLCDSHHGIYLPSIWTSNSENVWGIPQKDWDYISDPGNIENDDYLDVWDMIINNAVLVDDNGVKWSLHQNEDLFAVAIEEMSEQEIEEFFN